MAGVQDWAGGSGGSMDDVGAAGQADPQISPNTGTDSLGISPSLTMEQAGGSICFLTQYTIRETANRQKGASKMK